ncbi:sulfatase family protein [Prosthecobacter vanneervenii]|uniref:Putative sulfatase n=1 Tax=Prosthecobacter vanneervenii TaxID=48466 RepID=A0A7W8DLL9_9BACT|nr:sulfatase [Prosthecobacter vanneervenii]MBB5034519.1 putative sulfatase [Prosthecobacter vanneervenii]
MKFVLTSLFYLTLHTAAVAAGPNFVWIIADDMSPDTGAYGLKDVSTPHLDRLAAEGRRYARAYSTAPVCSASRSAFILGCYQTTTGLHPHDTENPQPLPAPYQHLPGMLREAGWFVTNAAAPGTVRNGRTVTKAKTHYNFEHDPAKMYDGSDWRKRAPGQPFFAQFQITEPHRPFPIPEQYDEAKLKAIQIPPNYPEHPLVRRDWYAYQRSVEMVDQRVGLILDQLRAEGVLEDTVVMFFADHGRPMPWGKQWLNAEGLQVPLILRGPGVTAGAVEERLVSLIDLAPSMLRLAGLPIPPWMEGKAILGGEFPQRSMLFAARDRCGDAMDRIRAVIEADAIFVRNFHPELPHLNWSGYKEYSYPGMPLLRVLNQEGKLNELQAAWLTPQREALELYDLKTDLHNMAKEPQAAAKVKELNAAMDAWIQSSHDQGAQGDPQTEPPLDQIQKDKRLEYERVWKTRLKKGQPSDAERVAWWEKSYGLSSDQRIP